MENVYLEQASLNHTKSSKKVERRYKMNRTATVQFKVP
jgi:hypothetical protein